MPGKTALVIVFSTFFLTACGAFANNISTYTNGLRCENYKDLSGNEGANCSYVCPDGSEKERTISGTISPLYAASRAELDAELCGVALQPALSPSPVPSAMPTETPTLPPTPSAQPSGTAEIVVTGSSLLTGTVTMCDTGGGLISFRIVQPPPDLSGKTLTVRIGERESACYINQTNPSLMTCTIPNGVAFPARVVVNLDRAVLNDFIYDGLWCTQLTTPLPTTTP